MILFKKLDFPAKILNIHIELYLLYYTLYCEKRNFPEILFFFSSNPTTFTLVSNVPPCNIILVYFFLSQPNHLKADGLSISEHLNFLINTFCNSRSDMHVKLDHLISLHPKKAVSSTFPGQPQTL